MIRALILVAVVGIVALGLGWFADQPGTLALTWRGAVYEMRPVVALAVFLAALAAAMLVWALLRFVLRIPTLASLAMRLRKRDKGYAALSQGMIAAGAGDVAGARRAARTAERALGHEPMALLLKAQAAQIAGDVATAEATFRQMADVPATRLFGLRGLYAEARRRGDEEAAHAIAEKAHGLAPLPWAGEAMLERHAMADDWQGALDVVERNFARKAIDRRTADRQRAVLKAGIGLALQDRQPDAALARAREAIKLAPDLTPAYALAGRMLSRRGDIRRAARVLEAGWRVRPHPDISEAYLNLRIGDSAMDRLSRARTLSRLAPDDRESRLLLGRAAMDAHDYALARATLAPLIEGEQRPSLRVCLLMADLEELEYGPSGRMREWLARAARAPRDPAWHADGIVSDSWSPASPLTGRIDAFRWEAPAERLAAPDGEAPLDVLLAPPALAIEQAEAAEAAFDMPETEPDPQAVLVVDTPHVVETEAPKREVAVPEVIEATPLIEATPHEPVTPVKPAVPMSVILAPPATGAAAPEAIAGRTLHVTAPDDPGPRRR